MTTQKNGRGRKPVDRAPRKSSYVKVADRKQQELAFQQMVPPMSEAEIEGLTRAGIISAEPASEAAEDARFAEIVSLLAGLNLNMRDRVLDAFHHGALLESLQRRGGTIKAVADATLLCVRKSEDYNQQFEGAKQSPDRARDVYFPFGLKSYAHMLHTKSMRLVSLALKDGQSNFESARDTCLDLINYAAFTAERLEHDASLTRFTEDKRNG